MTKKDFIRLADYIREHNSTGNSFTFGQLSCLANFCKASNPRFMRDRWFNYIGGKCGPCGGRVK